MKFVADCMLGKLAKWLRLTGFDTVYSCEAEDAELARIALREDRILLTRDGELAGRRMIRGRTLFIESGETGKQLRQVIEHLGIDPDVSQFFTRCAVCNEPIEDIPKESVEGKVPPYVFRTQDRFRKCPTCGRIYWRGTHVDHVAQALERVRHGGEPSLASIPHKC
jgi:uncharacterized protein with PIN domain